MVIKLRNTYPSINGLPVIHSVDTHIFEVTYFMHCMHCNFCNDQCCNWGADIDMMNVKRIKKYEKELEQFTGVKHQKWFDNNIKKWDHEYPGGYYTRTAMNENKKACVFLNPNGRGCMLHSFALDKGIDYHELKPFFCSIFPVTYCEGIIVIPDEIDEQLTACLGDGPTLYQGARDALRHFFGDQMIDELDDLEAEWHEEKKSA